MTADEDRAHSYIELAPGTNVSHYKIINKIGAGGMGEVYLADDTKLDRRVALKFLPAHLCKDDDCRSRFKREAQAVAKLNHPNIVTIFEVSEYKGRPFFAMEHVEGDSLRDVIKSGKLKLDTVIDLAKQILDGLNKAHQAGVIHRDIKPANIVIDADGRPKILDFGLATVRGSEKITKTGSTLGTIRYMSPEQARGEKVDHRSDLFSFGSVLYEMITGKAPFKGEHDAEEVYNVIHETPQPLARFCSHVPNELQYIIDKLLDKEIITRYQNAADVKVDFNRLIVLKKSPKGRRHVVSITAATLLIFIGGYFGYQRFVSTDTNALSRIAVLPFENLGATEDEYFADGITDEIISRLAKLSGFGVISRTSSMQYKGTDKSLKQIGAELGVDYVLEGSILWDKTGDTDRVRIIPQLIQVSDDRHLWAETYQRALTQIFELQAEIAISIANELKVTLLQSEREVLAAKPTENMEAYNAYLRALELESQANFSGYHLQLTIDMLERAVKLDPEFAAAYALLSRSHSSLFHWGADRTEERLRKAKLAVEKALELQPELPEAHLAYGQYHYIGSRDYERARQEYLRAERGLPNDSRVMQLLGVLHKRQGEFEKGIDYFKRGLELNPRHAMLAIEVGVSNHILRRYDEAERFYELGISLAPDQYIGYSYKFFLYSQSLGNLQSAREMLQQNPVISESWSMLFELELLERNYTAALQRLASFPEASQEQQSYEPRTLKAGLIYSLMGEQERSRVAFDSARTLLEEKLEEFPADNRIHALLGIAYAGLGRNKKALFYGQRAVELLPISMDAFEGPTYEQNLARIYILLGEQDAALDKIEYLLSIPSLWMSVGNLRIDPVWDPLRENPRFQALLEKYDSEP